MRLALVHDWLNQLGGAEDVLETLVRVFPDAPIHTSIYWRDKMPARFAAWDIRTTWLDRAPAVYRHHRAYLPLYAMAFGGLDLSEYDLVLSNKSGFCHGVRSGSAPHVCYCLAPTRYVWEYDRYTAREAMPAAATAALRPVISLLRRWDYQAAQRVTRFVAISHAVQSRIQSTYGRSSAIIHPPVDTSLFGGARAGSANMAEPYYLIVSRLVAYRGLDDAVRAFNKLDQQLVIAGEGPDRARLEAIAGPKIRFLGRVSERDLPGLFAGCRAYVLPGEEDFGIAPVQAQAAGRPVVALAAGGALDTVVDGVTGTLYREDSADALAEAVGSFDPSRFDPDMCQRNARRFDTQVFVEKIRRCVYDSGGEHQGPGAT